jgi:uncharacterized YccA/Bax inhibitor family protein
MALIEFKGRPSGRELMWFGLVMLALFGAIGTMLLWRAGSMRAAVVVWSVGAGLVIIFYSVRPFRLPIYLAWMFLVYPIGWLISHLLMGIIFFLLITPTAALMRLFRFDPLKRRLDRDAPTYWVDLKQETDRSRYFSQF